MRMERLTPMLNVSEIERSLNFYREEFELQDADGHTLWFGQATDELPTR
jgi:hypothetical protein